MDNNPTQTGTCTIVAHAWTKTAYAYQAATVSTGISEFLWVGSPPIPTVTGDSGFTWYSVVCWLPAAYNGQFSSVRGLWWEEVSQ